MAYKQIEAPEEYVIAAQEALPLARIYEDETVQALESARFEHRVSAAAGRLAHNA